jgi:tRNA 2-thiocytidine biosynthesis protein TtcA
MNLFYSGKLQSMPARYTTDDGRFEVIRPLIECDEKEIARFAELMAYPILPCNLCGSQEGLKRDAMTRLLDSLEQENPDVRSVMLNALKNVRPTHLLDREVLEAWHARPLHVRPDPEPRETEKHAAAEPVRSLPIVR